MGLLTGCLFSPGGGKSGLPEGSYFVRSTFDANYTYEQYFVVLPEGRWHWVEYGSNAAKVQLCKVTLRTGTYSLWDSTMVLIQEAEAPAAVKCGFSKQDFKALAPVHKSGAGSGDASIRNRTDTSFEAENLFGSRGGWRTYTRVKDPFGFY